MRLPFLWVSSFTVILSRIAAKNPFFNRYLSVLDYGNGDRVEYEYDEKGRITSETYEDGDYVYYKYDNNGALASVWDSATEVTTKYYYDFTDRMMKYVESGEDYSHSVGYEYDSLNNLTELVENINGTERTTTYTYDDDNRIKTSTTGNITVEYDYDSFGRVSTQTTKNGNTVILTESYTYKTTTSTTTSAQIATYTTSAPNGYSVTYSYTYDDNGNITSVSDGTNTITYEYDSSNQLIRENNQTGDYTYVWEYDNAGNILSRLFYDYTTGQVSSSDLIEELYYEYDDSPWGDLLTAHDEVAITYDQIGNPLNDGEWTYTWERGRQLTSMSKTGTVWNYTYNADGLRTQRANGTNTYSYIYNGSSLSQMSVDSNTLHFTYDANGTPLVVIWNGSTYYYVTNLQGDVTAILDSSRTAVVNYKYDAWGNLLSTTGTMAATLGAVNPLRYRGYVYDDETGLYYLQSRYYDPEIGRFINADAYASTGQGLLGNNMFVYCLNNPVCMVDYSGYDAIYVVDFKKDRGLPIVGHSILYLQDADGNWYKTQYMGVFPDKSTATIELRTADMTNIEAMVSNQTIEDIEYVYLSGDFTASLAYAEKIVEQTMADTIYFKIVVSITQEILFQREILITI